MTATVRFNREYGWRLAGVGAMMVAMTLWALYDGLLAYPRQNSSYVAVCPELVALKLTAGELIKPDGADGSLYEQCFMRHGLRVPKDGLSKLKTLNEQVQAQKVPVGESEAMRAQAVPTTRALLERPLKSQHEINSQFVMAAVALLAAVAAFGLLYRRSRYRFSAADDGLHGFTARVIGYDMIARADWSRWQEKRIVVFVLADGQRLKLDGWHYAGVEELVDVVLKHKPAIGLEATPSP